MNKIITYGIVAIGISILFSSLSMNAVAQVNVEGISKIYEDQTIICVSGHVVEKTGFICKIFNVDDQTLDEATTDLFKNPESDTFNIRVMD